MSEVTTEDVRRIVRDEIEQHSKHYDELHANERQSDTQNLTHIHECIHRIEARLDGFETKVKTGIKMAAGALAVLAGSSLDELGGLIRYLAQFAG